MGPWPVFLIFLQLLKNSGLKIISIEDLISYRLKNESLIHKDVTVNLPTSYGDFKLAAYRQLTNGQEHLVLWKGTWEKNEPVLVTCAFILYYRRYFWFLPV